MNRDIYKGIMVTWFEDSPSMGDPDCVCSLCGQLIEDEESESASVPVRVFDIRRSQEARFHQQCWSKVEARRKGSSS